MVDIGCDTHMQLSHEGLGIDDVDGGYKLLLMITIWCSKLKLAGVDADAILRHV